MQFARYLKTCRENFSMTQDQLVTELYLFDDELFEGVSSTTLSRWERGVTETSFNRMAGIIAYFQSLAKLPLPCLQTKNAEEIEALICDDDIGKLFKPRTMVADIPFDHRPFEPFELISLRHHPRAEELLELNAMFHRSINTPFTRVDTEKFKQWIDYPGNLFLAVTYKTSFLGLLFTLRLKPEKFEKIIDFSMKKDSLRREDFAAPNEEGSIYMLSFFALSQEVATMLFRRFYAHLIANQRQTSEVGFISSFDEAHLIAEKLKLQRTGKQTSSGQEIFAYRAVLSDLMTSPMFLKTLFPRHHCS